MDLLPVSRSTAKSLWLRSTLIVPLWEIVAVMAVILAPPLIDGIYYDLAHPTGAIYQTFSDDLFLRAGAFEGLLLVGFVIYLLWRGWKLDDLRIKIGWRASWDGVVLFALTAASIFILIFVFFFIATWLGSDPFGHLVSLYVPRHFAILKGSPQLSWSLIIGFTILNAFYEELVYMAYGFNLWAKKYGSHVALLLIVLLRIAIHAYQGTEHVLQIALCSLIFGLWYKNQRKVWPLILAHILIDLFSLGMLKTLYGH